MSLPLTEQVRTLVQENVSWKDLEPFGLHNIDDLIGGKMLRTKLAQMLLPADASGEELKAVFACAAVELIHTASLFHDDIIDGASLRRGKPTLWKRMSPNCSILVGDMLFCEALKILTRFCSEKTGDFTRKVHEVCAAEAQQELILRGNPADPESSLQIARGKTGPLFAFTAASCGGANPALTAALEEAGYRLGTAYQLADDLLDEHGEEDAAGKSLGTDRLRNKFTLAHSSSAGGETLLAQIESMSETALTLLNPWPRHQQGLNNFFESELRRAINISAPPSSTLSSTT